MKRNLLNSAQFLIILHKTSHRETSYREVLLLSDLWKEGLKKKKKEKRKKLLSYLRLRWGYPNGRDKD